MKGQASIERTKFSARHLRGQASMELLITLGIVLAFTIPVVFLLFTVTQVGYEDTAKAQADATSRSLADTLNFIYSQGEGAKRTILLNTPTSMETLTIGNGEVVARIKTSDGYYDGVSPTFAKISGGTQEFDESGLFIIEVRAIDTDPSPSDVEIKVEVEPVVG